MTPNPYLKKLGYAETDRVVILHTDDIGMCQASLQAFIDLWEFGTISSGAVMVPCAWFPATAEFCRTHPEVDLGVHATLNAEWESYRWSPVSTVNPASGLLDEDGYFHQWHAGVYAHARPEAVEMEVNAQVEKALAAGIEVTHIDSHMGTILHPRYIHGYLRAGQSRQIPNLLPRAEATGFWMMGSGETGPEVYQPLLEQFEADGLPMVDTLNGMPLEHAEDHLGLAKKLLSELPTGITHFMLHPSIETPELRAIAPDWRARVANYQAFMSPELRDFIRNSGIQVIGYRALRAALRS